MARRVAGWVLGLALAGAVALAALRWLDVAVYPVPVLQAVFPIWGAAIVLLTGVAAVCRYWRLVVAGAMPCAIVAVLAARSLSGSTVPSGQDDLVVLATNLQYGQGSARRVVQAVEDLDVDILVIIEITPQATQALRDAGLDRILPNLVGRSTSGPGGSVIRSRFPMSKIGGDPDELRIRTFDEPVAKVATPAGPVVVRAAHPYPPIPDLVADWREGLAQTAQWVDEQPAQTPLVVAGDFNASHAHPAFRRLERSLADAHRAAGGGWVRTWPQGRRFPPFVQIDHVLVRHLGVVDAGVVPIPSTDHAAVWARLSPRTR